jgi:hypothetical protein
VASAYAALVAGDLDKVPRLIEALDDRVAASPDDGMAAFYAFTMRDWLMAEGVLSGVAGIEALWQAAPMFEYGEQAYKLRPDDARVPAFLGMTKLNVGQLFGDTALIEDGMTNLDDAIARLPAYGHFLRICGLSQFPADSAEFATAVRDVSAYVEDCGLTPDQTGSYAYLSGPLEFERHVCNNEGIVAHSWEGASFVLGDVLLKSGAVDRARAMYNSAKNSPSYDEWPFASELEQRIASADQFAAQYADDDAWNDPPLWILSGRVCRGCHQASADTSPGASPTFGGSWLNDD